MKKIFAAWLAVLLVGVTAPAFADVTIIVDVFKDKDVNITENIRETWNITFDVDVIIASTGGAEAKAIANITNTDNEVRPDETVLIGPAGDQENALADGDRFDLDASILSSITGNQGEVQLNQDVGNNVNQGNLVAVAASNADGSAADSQAAVDQLNTRNFSRLVNESLQTDLTDRLALIDTSIVGNTGIVQVNQNAGDNNNQTNALSAAIGLGPGPGPLFPLGPGDNFAGLGSLGAAVALSEASLGQENTNNIVESINTVKFDTLTSSITGNSGIVSANQTVGNMNNQGSVVSLAAGL